MHEVLFETALTQSIWAGLALALIFYIFKKQEVRDEQQAKREMKYQLIIRELADRLQVVELLKKDTTTIKELLIKSPKS